MFIRWKEFIKTFIFSFRKGSSALSCSWWSSLPAPGGFSYAPFSSLSARSWISNAVRVAWTGRVDGDVVVPGTWVSGVALKLKFVSQTDTDILVLLRYWYLRLIVCRTRLKRSSVGVSGSFRDWKRRTRLSTVDLVGGYARIFCFMEVPLWPGDRDAFCLLLPWGVLCRSWRNSLGERVWGLLFDGIGRSLVECG